MTKRGRPNWAALFASTTKQELPREQNLGANIQIPSVVPERRRSWIDERSVVRVRFDLHLIGIHVEQVVRSDRQADAVELVADLGIEEQLRAEILDAIEAAVAEAAVVRRAAHDAEAAVRVVRRERRTAIGTIALDGVDDQRVECAGVRRTGAF